MERLVAEWLAERARFNETHVSTVGTLAAGGIERETIARHSRVLQRNHVSVLRKLCSSLRPPQRPSRALSTDPRGETGMRIHVAAPSHDVEDKHGHCACRNDGEHHPFTKRRPIAQVVIRDRGRPTKQQLNCDRYANSGHPDRHVRWDPRENPSAIVTWQGHHGLRKPRSPFAGSGTR